MYLPLINKERMTHREISREREIPFCWELVVTGSFISQGDYFALLGWYENGSRTAHSAAYEHFVKQYMQALLNLFHTVPMMQHLLLLLKSSLYQLSPNILLKSSMFGIILGTVYKKMSRKCKKHPIYVSSLL